MELETINKLYLELSQVATAKTENQLNLERGFARRGRLLQDIYNSDETHLSSLFVSRISDEMLAVTDDSVEKMKDDLILEMRALLESARAIANRQGENTNWEAFDHSIAKFGISQFTARVYEQGRD